MTATPLYILDTNIWLDWLVFSHDAMPALQAMQAAHEIEIIYTAEMAEELADVLSREHFNLSIEQQNTAMLAMRQAAREVEPRAAMLPIRCRDKDDQVFIDTALAYRVDFLLSKDKHLLSLKNRATKQNLRIASLDKWFKTLNTPTLTNA